MPPRFCVPEPSFLTIPTLPEVTPSLMTPVKVSTVGLLAPISKVPSPFWPPTWMLPSPLTHLPLFDLDQGDF